MTESAEEDFHFWGTPIEDEEEMRAGQHRKVGRRESEREHRGNWTVAGAAGWQGRARKCAGMGGLAMCCSDSSAVLGCRVGAARNATAQQHLGAL